MDHRIDDQRRVTRRDALRVAGGIAAAGLAACRAAPHTDGPPAAAAGRLLTRPSTPTLVPATGLSSLGLASGRDGLLYVPPTYRADTQAPLVLMLHGAGGSSEGGIRPFLPLAASAGLILLAPDSRGRTWDFLYGPYGADVAFIDQALSHAFHRCAIDASRVVIEGFSDGASYALSLGLTNGDLFSRIVAFSPCILAPAAHAGRPRIFLSHGTDDHVLPVDRCRRRLAERLTGEGYVVAYREFAGPHTVPSEIARAAVEWIRA